MNAKKGYFCLIQYCPDMARLEAANVGVLLFSPDHGFIQAKVTPNINRIRRFFGADTGGYLHLSAMKEAIVNRVEIERAQFKTLHDLEQFVYTRANQVLLTPPKPILVSDPQADLNALFQELVADPVKALTIQAAIPLRKRLDDVLMEQSVKRFIRTKLKIELPSLKQTVTAPYGFNNGRMNLIRPIPFKHQVEASVKTAACRYGVEGLTLFNHPDPTFGQLQMIVVADFSSAPADSESMVRNIFHESNVRLFTSDGLETLKQEILAHAKPLAQSV